MTCRWFQARTETARLSQSFQSLRLGPQQLQQEFGGSPSQREAASGRGGNSPDGTFPSPNYRLFFSFNSRSWTASAPMLAASASTQGEKIRVGERGGGSLRPFEFQSSHRHPVPTVCGKPMYKYDNVCSPS